MISLEATRRDTEDLQIFRNKNDRLMEDYIMKHIMTLDTRDMAKSAENGGCGECQTSCQSACKTSCGIANQDCENNR